MSTANHQHQKISTWCQHTTIGTLRPGGMLRGEGGGALKGTAPPNYPLPSHKDSCDIQLNISF